MKIMYFGKIKNFIKNKKKALILTGMALLLVVTGVLNYKLNTAAKDEAVNTSATASSFFETYRTDRTASRESQLALLNEIINSEYATSAEKATAIESKTNLASKMETELILEGLIKAKGFEDAVVTIGSEYYNCIVKGQNLSDAQVAQISSVIVSETKTDETNIKIFEVE